MSSRLSRTFKRSQRLRFLGNPQVYRGPFPTRAAGISTNRSEFFHVLGNSQHAFVIQGLSTGIRLNGGNKAKEREGFQANMEIVPRVGSRAQSSLCVCGSSRKRRLGLFHESYPHARPNQQLQSAAYGETLKPYAASMNTAGVCFNTHTSDTPQTQDNLNCYASESL